MGASDVTSERDALQCYVMLSTFEETTLGFGVSLAFNGGTLVNARSPFEYLSFEAFSGDANSMTTSFVRSGLWICALCHTANFKALPTCTGCRASKPIEALGLLPQPASLPVGARQSICGTESFTHFLPIYISMEHFDSKLCGRCLQAAWCRVVLEQVPEEPDPALVMDAVWHVLPALMNSTAVAMMGGDLHMSDVALRGYYHLHRLMLAMATSELIAKVNVQVAEFAAQPERRTKEHVPNLGHLIPRLLLSFDPVQSWNTISEALLCEALDRSALHAFRSHPSLHSETDPQKFTSVWWETAAKGFRMLLFAAHFLRSVSKFGSHEEIARHYDGRLGQPSSSEQDDLRCTAEAIKSIDSWQHFAQEWNQSAKRSGTSPTESISNLLAGDVETIRSLLFTAEANSLKKSYHKTGLCGFQVESRRRLYWFVLGGTLVAAVGLLLRMTSGQRGASSSS